MGGGRGYSAAGSLVESLDISDKFVSVRTGFGRLVDLRTRTSFVSPRWQDPLQHVPSNCSHQLTFGERNVPFACNSARSIVSTLQAIWQSFCCTQQLFSAACSPFESRT